MTDTNTRLALKIVLTKGANDIDRDHIRHVLNTTLHPDEDDLIADIHDTTHVDQLPTR